MSLKGQKVLVAGAAGLTGSNLIARLLQEGAHVRATLHRREPVVVDERIEYLWCDLKHAEDCKMAVEGVRYVFLCAANTSGAATIASTPMVHVTPNLVMNSQMLEAAYQTGVEKFVWLSSTTGYPVSGERPVREEEMFDGEPYEKYYFVGWMKRFTEILCKMYGEKLVQQMTTIVLRPTNIYGINDDFEFATSHVIPALIRKVVERWDPLEVWGTGEDVRDAIYVEDMVEAIVTAVQTLDSHVALNIGLGKTYSVKEILSMLLELDGFENARITYNTSKPTMIPIRCVDTSKAEAVMGFKAQTDLREGLAKTLEWYRQSRSLPRPVIPKMALSA
jgi:GDP-L-fucose synthase